MPKPLLSSPLHPLSVSSRTVHIPGAHTCTQAHKISHTPPTLSETVKTGAHTPPFHGVPIQAAAALPKLLVLLSCHTLGAAAPGPTRLIWTQVGGGHGEHSWTMLLFMLQVCPGNSICCCRVHSVLIRLWKWILRCEEASNLLWGFLSKLVYMNAAVVILHSSITIQNLQF